MQDKIDKCRKDVDSTREKYKAALNELNSYNRKYTEDMMEVSQTDMLKKFRSISIRVPMGPENP